MKPAAAPRVPHRDRPAVVQEHCTCLWVHRQNAEAPDGPALARLHSVNPTCPLHGPGAQEAPY